MKICIIVSEFYPKISKMLIDGAISKLKKKKYKQNSEKACTFNGKKEIYYYLSQPRLVMILTDLYKSQMVVGHILQVTWHIIHIKFIENLMY